MDLNLNATVRDDTVKNESKAAKAYLQQMRKEHENSASLRQLRLIIRMIMITSGHHRTEFSLVNVLVQG